MFQEVLLKNTKYGSQSIIDPNMKTFSSFQKIQNNVNRIHLQCKGFIDILDIIKTDPTELKTYCI